MLQDFSRNNVGQQWIHFKAYWPSRGNHKSRIGRYKLTCVNFATTVGKLLSRNRTTVEAPVSGHPREAKIVFVTGADRLPE